ARFHTGRLRNDPTFLPAAIDDEVLDRLDADRIVVDVQCARGLARRGTDAARELGKVVGRMQNLESLAPLMAKDEIVPVGNDFVDRAAGLTERDAAVHAARALFRRFLILEREDEFPIIAHALGNRQQDFLDALELHETGDLAHHAVSFCLRSIARSASSFAAYCSPRARRYSCGNTLMNLPRVVSQRSSSANARVLPVKRRWRSISSRTSGSSYRLAWGMRPLPAAASSS